MLFFAIQMANTIKSMLVVAIRMANAMQPMFFVAYPVHPGGKCNKTNVFLFIQMANANKTKPMVVDVVPIETQQN